MERRAFTLVEVMVAIALLAIALLGVVGAIAYGTRHSGSGSELSEASHLNKSILNYIQETTLLDTVDIDKAWPDQNSGLADAPTDFRQLDAAPLGGLTFRPAQIERYRRRIESQRVTDDPLNYRHDLARVRVSIFWDSKQGRRSVVMTGLVSINRD